MQSTLNNIIIRDIYNFEPNEFKNNKISLNAIIIDFGKVINYGPIEKNHKIVHYVEAADVTIKTIIISIREGVTEYKD